MSRAHAMCWREDEQKYIHICYRQLGHSCQGCGKPAGTLWTPYWCPDCDVARLDRITLQFEDLLRSLKGGK